MINAIKSLLFGILSLSILVSPFIISQNINQQIEDQTRFNPTSMQMMLGIPEINSSIQKADSQKSSSILKGMNKEPIIGPV